MDNGQVAKLLRYRWPIFWVLATAYLFVYFHRLSLSVVADTLIRKFNTSTCVMELLGSIHFYCYACMQLLAELMADANTAAGLALLCSFLMKETYYHQPAEKIVSFK